MSEHDPSQPAGAPSSPRPPPMMLSATALGADLRKPPAPLQKPNWKKILIIFGAAALGLVALLALTAALIFGGCMYLVEKAGH